MNSRAAAAIASAAVTIRTIGAHRSITGSEPPAISQSSSNCSSVGSKVFTGPWYAPRPLTPTEYRQLADREDAAALRALDQGDAAAAREYRLLALRHREVAIEMERVGLPTLPKARTVNSAQMTDEHRAAMSASRPSKDKAFMVAVRKAGYSLNRLAEAVGMSPSSLSQARRKPSDPLYRRIPEAKAKAIEGIIGWPASDWP